MKPAAKPDDPAAWPVPNSNPGEKLALKLPMSILNAEIPTPVSTAAVDELPAPAFSSVERAKLFELKLNCEPVAGS